MGSKVKKGCTQVWTFCVGVPIPIRIDCVPLSKSHITPPRWCEESDDLRLAVGDWNRHIGSSGQSVSSVYRRKEGNAENLNGASPHMTSVSCRGPVESHGPRQRRGDGRQVTNSQSELSQEPRSPGGGQNGADCKSSLSIRGWSR